MTDISLGSYINKARENLDGTLRTDSGGEGKLVNKGELGTKIGTWLGFGDVGTRDERQQVALEGFKKALTEQYGSEIANEAMKDLGNVLTGRTVMDTVSKARNMQRETVQSNRALYQEFSAPPDGIRGNGEQEYKMRFTREFLTLTNNGQHQVTPQEVRQCQENARQKVLELRNDPDFDVGKVRQAREDLDKSIANLMLSIAGRRDPEVVLDRMNKVEEQLAKLEGLENGGKPLSQEKRQELMQVSTNNAMLMIQSDESRDRLTLVRAQRRSLIDDTSVLRSLYTGAREMSLFGTPEQKQKGERLTDLCESLVTGFGARLGTLGTTREQDLEQLKDGSTINPKTLSLGRTSLEQKFGEFGPGKNFLDTLKSVPEFGLTGEPQEPGELSGWHKWEVLSVLEQHVEAFAQTSGKDLPYGECIAKFRGSIGSDETLPVGLRYKLTAGLDALEAEHNLFEELGRHEEYSGIAKEDMWQLLTPGSRTDKTGPEQGKWGQEQFNEGSLAGMYRGLTTMLEGQRLGTRLGTDHVEEMHRTSTENTFREVLSGFYRPMYDQSEQDIQDAHNDYTIPQDFRVNHTDVGFVTGTELSPGGRQELVDFMNANPDWFGEPDVEENGLKLDFKPLDEGVSRDKMREFLTGYREGIRQAGDDPDAKLRVIADTAQKLYRSHLFDDGNTRTMLFSVMNRMLLDNGLSPTILNEPKTAGGFSLDEFIGQIREGQERFRQLKNEQV
jgi:hypothetical protein